VQPLAGEDAADEAAEDVVDAADDTLDDAADDDDTPDEDDDACAVVVKTLIEMATGSLIAFAVLYARTMIV